jgi:hypothetical protein
MPVSIATLAQYRTQYDLQNFVETGTYLGDGTQNALVAGFQHVYTIEAHTGLYQAACQRFAAEPRVEVFPGSSIVALPELLPRLSERTLFWLDSHTCGGATAGAWDTPLIGELRLIATLPRKDHVILIDDMHLVAQELPGMAEIMMRLAHINMTYKHAIIPSGDPALGNDILVSVP